MIPFVRKLIAEDFWLKLFSFVLAVLTWFTVNSMANQKEGLSGGPLALGSGLRQKDFTRLPVVILSSAQDVRSFRVSPSEVDVTIQGEPNVLKATEAKDIRVLVDLTGIGAAHDLRKRIEVSIPAGVTLVRVVPEDVQVIFPPSNQ
jgi:YbbR domain-containing protein